MTPYGIKKNHNATDDSLLKNLRRTSGGRKTSTSAHAGAKLLRRAARRTARRAAKNTIRTTDAE
jgi:hypothetical protein